MSELSFNSFFNGTQAFGLNVKLPERTMKQIGKTAGDLAGGVLDPIVNYLEENDNVFTGNVQYETNKLHAAIFNTSMEMGKEHIKAKGDSSFDAQF